MEIRNSVYAHSNIFTMVIDKIRVIIENFTKSHMAGSWEWNSAFVINLSKTQKLSQHQIWASIKNITE